MAAANRKYEWLIASLISLAVCLLFASAVLVWASSRAGSVRAGIEMLKGHSLVVAQETISLIGDGSDQMFEVRNVSSSKYDVLGTTTSCTCLSCKGLPLTLKPNARGTFSISANSTRNKVVSLLIITNDPKRNRIRVNVIVSPAKNS